mmetsp:Transcript_20091/g.69637  ORF Transcript_20091/g.69637 Transcript_20091/m.69637 type:complete len:352 (-) Transcript_20091:626-1681(-)
MRALSAGARATQTWASASPAGRQAPEAPACARYAATSSAPRPFRAHFFPRPRSRSVRPLSWRLARSTQWSTAPWRTSWNGWAAPSVDDGSVIASGASETRATDATKQSDAWSWQRTRASSPPSTRTLRAMASADTLMTRPWTASPTSSAATSVAGRCFLPAGRRARSSSPASGSTAMDPRRWRGWSSACASTAAWTTARWPKGLAPNRGSAAPGRATTKPSTAAGTASPRRWKSPTLAMTRAPVARSRASAAPAPGGGNAAASSASAASTAAPAARALSPSLRFLPRPGLTTSGSMEQSTRLARPSTERQRTLTTSPLAHASACAAGARQGVPSTLQATRPSASTASTKAS